jgi:transposase-like protein
MMAGDDRTELELLREIARWTREAALPIVRERVERLLDTDARKRVYAAIEGGTAGVKAIEKATGVNSSKDISPWAKQWEEEGIVDRGSNPPKATFSLSELGIAPAPPKTGRPREAAAK